MWLFLSAKITGDRPKGHLEDPEGPLWLSDHTWRAARLCLFICPKSKLVFSVALPYFVTVSLSIP